MSCFMSAYKIYLQMNTNVIMLEIYKESNKGQYKS